MNAAKPAAILDGDFVLVRAEPRVPDNEIVVVGIMGLDSRATVKRLKRRNGRIILVPETTDPIHSEIDWEQEFDEHDEQIQIIGVVEAIFRKKPS
jgi:SOS-response transcriptional repressor LexA